jgi:hypothetical protein
MRSTCIFGSTARNRSDSYSDRDILVVAPSKREVANAARRWSADGWSVAKFTRDQITRMTDRGSLFLQHLKQEAIIVEDDDGFLASLIDRYQPKRQYEDELCDSLGLLRDVSHQRLDYWSILCSADIAYVAIRNIAIARLAASGAYTFDYIELMKRFGSECCLSAAKLDALRQLRILKHSYRGRDPTISSPLRTLTVALEGADELFGLSAPSQPTDPTEMISGYRGLRLLELELVGKVDPRHLDSLPSHDLLAVAWTFIRDPRGYPDKPKLRGHGWLRNIRALAERRYPKGLDSTRPAC